MDFRFPIDIPEYLERENGDHVLLHPMNRFLGGEHFQPLGQAVEHFDKRKSAAVDLVLKRFADRLPCRACAALRSVRATRSM